MTWTAEEVESVMLSTAAGCPECSLTSVLMGTLGTGYREATWWVDNMLAHGELCAVRGKWVVR